MGTENTPFRTAPAVKTDSRVTAVITAGAGGHASPRVTAVLSGADVVEHLRQAIALPANRAAHTIHWLLRIACAAEFVGHGAFGIVTKPIWTTYFAVVGIPPALAYRLMPVIGTIDISLGILALFAPIRAALLYMAFWGLLTATIRPLAGEAIWEWIERVPNWGIPLALLYLRGFGEVRGLFGARGWRDALKSWLR